MPELPETETIARDLNARIAGSRIERVSVIAADVLREAPPRRFAQKLRGRTVLRVWRRAKLVVIDLDHALHIVVQPRFTGALLVDDGSLPGDTLDYLTVTLSLGDGRKLHYRDVRRLGTVALMDSERFAEYCAGLGVEPLDPIFTTSHLSELLRGSRQAVKKVLMDQRRLAGVGNIYANEALWRAGVDPSREARTLSADEASRLHAGLTSVLRESIAARGTSFRDYRDASGQRGGFAARLAAYGRGGLPCQRCRRQLVATHAIDGRSTVFCPTCQR